ncbi:MAG: C4-dicarboxylate transporter DctA [Acidobacteria bacterium]|nr:C4-dicarboxylate transporter DctA [Acidobacteriota bacterium]
MLRGLTRRLYFWVLVGIAIGCAIGIIAPATAVKLKPLSDGFINLVKMLIGPIVFLTVVLGLAGVGDMKKVGRVGVKTLVYFEVVSTLALIIGLIVANTMKPGAGFNVDPATLDASAVSAYTNPAAQQTATQFVLRIIPRTFADAFSGSGDMLQVLLIAILFGYALSRIGTRGDAVHKFLEQLSHIFFGMMNVVMKLAPIGAGAAMAFTLGAYGLAALMPMARLMVSYYATCFIFIVGVLGLIAAWTGFSIFRFILYIKDEVLTVLGTSSSESALVPLMQKLERLGCSKPVVGLVIPSGMSFNMDGTNIYLTMAIVFLAQAMNIDLSWGQQVSLLGVAMLTSKGMAGVFGGSFLTLAATLAVVPTIPIAGLALILGVDRFLAEIRTATNFIGNGVAAVVISRWEGELDAAMLAAELGGGSTTPR